MDESTKVSIVWAVALVLLVVCFGIFIRGCYDNDTIMTLKSFDAGYEQVVEQNKTLWKKVK